MSVELNNWYRLSDDVIIDWGYDKSNISDTIYNLKNNEENISYIYSKSESSFDIEDGGIFVSDRIYALNSDRPIPYKTYMGSESNKTSVIEKQKVRILLRSGYTYSFDNGFYLNISLADDDGKVISCISLLLNPLAVTFNSLQSPISVGNNYFNRYVEFYIVSPDYIRKNDSNFFSNSQIANNNLVRVDLFELYDITNENGQTYFKGRMIYGGAIKTTNELSSIYPYIEKSVLGDYIEFGCANGSNPASDYIYALKSKGNWHIMHELNVFERIGEGDKIVQSLNLMQTDNFDEWNKFRPILPYSNISIGYSIQYTLRLYNSDLGQHVVRTATKIFENSKEWGLSLRKLNFRGFINNPIKVYNKIIQSENIQTIQTDSIQNNSIVKYLPIERSSISLTGSSVGKNISISPIGKNVIEFIVTQLKDGKIVNIDLSLMDDMYLNFGDAFGKVIEGINILGQKGSNGTIQFSIDEITSAKILSQFNAGFFYMNEYSSFNGLINIAQGQWIKQGYSTNIIEKDENVIKISKTK